MNKDKLGGIGASEIGALFVRGGIKSKSAQSLAFKKAKELITGFKEVITTKQMEHGILHEFSAFQTVVEPLFPDVASIYVLHNKIPSESMSGLSPSII